MNQQDLERAKELIFQGGVVAIPTETVYGLSASIQSEEGIKRIFTIKERPLFDPLIVHISKLEQRQRVVSEWPEIAAFLAENFWPGPLTLVLAKHPNLNPLITAGLETVGIRMPAHPVALSLIDACDMPLAAPSANKFGKTSPTKAEHVKKSFEKENLFILDGGPSEVGLESTVISLVSLVHLDQITILRPGAITESHLRSALTKWARPFEIKRASSMASPGNIEHHYMPGIPLVVIQGDSSLKPKTTQLILEQFQLEKGSMGAELRLDQNPRLAARSLYSGMRECSDSGASFIYVIRKPAHADGLWEAIWDRIYRAASMRF